MDLTPGSQARDSRSLSVEAAQYGQQEIDATVEFRRIEAQMEAARAKVEAVRLQKLQTEAAREDTFQEERRERQAGVKASVNDHHLEGMNKAVESYNDFTVVLKGLQQEISKTMRLPFGFGLSYSKSLLVAMITSC